MGKKDKLQHGGASKTDIWLYDPEDLKIVEDAGSAIFDERAKIDVPEAFVLNVKAYGVLQPIVARKNPETGNFEVVAGRRRVKACRIANKMLRKEGSTPHRVPVVMKRAEGQVLMGMMISENEQREDDTPLNRARKMARFMDTFNASAEDAAVTFGVSVSTVKNMTGLLDAPKDVQRAIESGRLAASDGYKLAKLEPSEAKKRLAQIEREAPRAEGRKRNSNGAHARAIADGAEAMRGKREIRAKLDEVSGLAGDASTGATHALRWVLGGEWA